MARRVYKYEIKVVDGWQTIEMPRDAMLLNVAAQGEDVFAWLAVNTDNETEHRSFWVAGTGHDVPDDALFYRGTAHARSGLVWHVFERSNN